MSGPAAKKPSLADTLIEGLPDLVVIVRRDGTIVTQRGGAGVGELKPGPDSVGKRLEAVWPEPIATTVRQLVRRALAIRGAAEVRLQSRGQEYEARASAQGPDRALLMIRPALAADPVTLDATDVRPRPLLGRSEFLQRFKESMALATLREQPLAVAVIQVDGIADIAQAMASRLAEQVMSLALVRLAAQPLPGPGAEYLGQLSDTLLVAVVETADREVIETRIGRLCASLREPVSLDETVFHLTPYAGVAILGPDASTARVLLDNARFAASEARRAASQRICFHSDTLSLRSLARLDIARELREAVANGDVRLRYVGRHALASGRLVSYAGYFSWLHPLRGEIAPAEFLRVAESTGLALELSRSVLVGLRADLRSRLATAAADVRLSISPLRHHLLHEDFVADVQRLLADGLPPERLELRVAEETLIARDPVDLLPLVRLGVRLVVDEVGRGMGSLDRLARAPLWGLQLDRAWTAAVCTDEVARKVCRAAISMATALDLVPIAFGVDTGKERDALLSLGCQQGSGDLYLPDSSGAAEPRERDPSLI